MRWPICSLFIALVGSAAAMGRRFTSHPRRFQKRCCAALSANCTNTHASCCQSVGPMSACSSLRTRVQCESSHPAQKRSLPGRELCAWLGGHCTVGSLDDCAEPPAVGVVDYYGEHAAFESSCSSGASSQCPGLSAALARYAVAHEKATRDAAPVEGMSASRLFVIRDHWKNVGMGFMPQHVATVMLWALATGMYVYVENYGRYDWTRYFEGLGGLDLRWTAAKQRMWKARYLTIGVCTHACACMHMCTYGQCARGRRGP